MKQYLQGFFEGTLEIDTGSWHAKWYNYWRQNAKRKARGYKENLCHYVRVLLFWAPLMWLRRGKIGKAPIWSVATAILTIPAVYVAVTHKPQIVIAFISLVVIVVLATAGLFAEAALKEKYPDRATRIGHHYRAAKKAIARPFKFAYSVYDQAMKWFLFTHILRVVYPWSVLIIAGLIVGAFLYPIIDLYIIGPIVGIATIIGALIAYVLVMDMIDAIRARRSPAGPSKGRRLLNGVRGTLMVASNYAMAKKKGICPFITFRDQTDTAR